MLKITVATICIILSVAAVTFLAVQRLAEGKGSDKSPQESTSITQPAVTRPAPLTSATTASVISQPDRNAKKAESAPHSWEQAAEEIEALSTETLAQSLSRLSDIEMYCWPPVADEGGIIIMPIPKEKWPKDAAKILTNRRALKVCEDFSNLPKEEASRLISKEIDDFLPVYKKIFEADWEDRRSKGSDAGVSMRMSNMPDHSPTLAGARLKVLSLVLIAGSLELKDARQAILKVVDEALRQRKQFYSGPRESEAQRYLTLNSTGIYNRSVLATGLIGTAGALGKLPQTVWETVEPRMYYFGSTADLLDARLPRTLDFSRGKSLIRVYQRMDDSGFDAIVAKYGKDK